MSRLSLHRPRARVRLGFAFIAALFATAPQATAALRITHTHAVNPDVWVVDEPDVRQRNTTYTDIEIRPGDKVVVRAGGCVQTAGTGRTWKRYVDPDPAASYYGTARLPGLPERNLRDIVGQTLTVPMALNPQVRYFLDLGYVDDTYLDGGGNGYWGHDDGTHDQCKLGNPTGPLGEREGDAAWVEISVTHDPNVPPPAQGAGVGRPFDIVNVHGQTLDGRPVNPVWRGQLDRCGWAGPWRDAKCQPNATELCEAIYRNDNLSRAQLAQWLPGGPPTHDGNDVWMHTHGRSIFGRIDLYAQPVFYYGRLEFADHGSADDDDYSWNLQPLAGEGFAMNGTRANGLPLLEHPFGDPGAGTRLHVEFLTDPTIDYFGDKAASKVKRTAATDWWMDFHTKVDDDAAKAQAFLREGSGGKDPLALVYGVLGFDCQHGGGVEVHPAYAMAIRVREAVPGNLAQPPERWMLYYVNKLDNGWAGKHDFALVAPRDWGTLALPEPVPPLDQEIYDAEITGTMVQYTVSGSKPAARDWKLSYKKGAGVFVTVPIEDPARVVAGVAGSVEIRWKTRPLPVPPAPDRPRHPPCLRFGQFGLLCPPLPIPHWDPDPVPPRAYDWRAGIDEDGWSYERMVESFTPERRALYDAAQRALRRELSFTLGEGGQPLVFESLAGRCESGRGEPEHASPAAVVDGFSRYALAADTSAALLRGEPGALGPEEVLLLRNLGSAANAGLRGPALLRLTGPDTALLDLWPLISRPERPATGQMLRVTTPDGHEVVARIDGYRSAFVAELRLDGDPETLHALVGGGEMALLTPSTIEPERFTGVPADVERLDALYPDSGEARPSLDFTTPESGLSSCAGTEPAPVECQVDEDCAFAACCFDDCPSAFTAIPRQERQCDPTACNSFDPRLVCGLAPACDAGRCVVAPVASDVSGSTP